MSSTPWKVVVEPRGDNDEDTPEKNHGGMVIYLQQGNGPKQEVTRVAFARRNSKNPKDSFKVRMKREHAKAQEAADFLNEKAASAGALA